jgi:type 1 glutamine amidotransferase
VAAVHCGVVHGAETTPRKIRVAVVTGGHGFEEKPFFSLFEGYPDIEFAHAPQKDQSEIFEDLSGWAFDVVAFYNLTQDISAKRRENLLALTDRGVGIVALHHSLGSFNPWPEFKRIIGGKFLMYDQKEDDGQEYKRSSAGGGPPLKVQIHDPEHPITRGLTDFEVPEEFYGGMWFAPDNHVLLTTDHPQNDKTIGWVREYRKSRVCGLQPGHGPPVYQHPTYRELVVRAIRWTARRA